MKNKLEHNKKNTKNKTKLFSNLIEIKKISLSNIMLVSEKKNIGKLLSTKTITPSLIEVNFECLKDGYRDWQWTISLSQVDIMSKITVNEVNLIPKNSITNKKDSQLKRNIFYRKHHVTGKLLINDKDTYFFK